MLVLYRAIESQGEPFISIIVQLSAIESRDSLFFWN